MEIPLFKKSGSQVQILLPLSRKENEQPDWNLNSSLNPVKQGTKIFAP
jgi:hypothetical protein